MKKKVMKFTVVFEKAVEGGYIVNIPSLPGCMTQGETFEEAETMAKDAIQCYCESLVKNGESVPEETKEYIGKVSLPVFIGK